MRHLPRRGWANFLILGLVLLLTGCGGTGEPTLIAAHPQAGSPLPLEYPHENPETAQQSLVIELRVQDVEVALDQSYLIASEYNALPMGSREWSDSTGSYLFFSYYLPTENVEGAKRAFMRLGEVEDVQLIGAPNSAFTALSLQFHAPTSAPTLLLPSLPEEIVTLQPVRTLQSAFGVFSVLALFLLDILIWLVVVGGPFALVGYGAYSLHQRYHVHKGRLVRRELPLSPPPTPPHA